jgi:hypothetical protein
MKAKNEKNVEIESAESEIKTKYVEPEVRTLPEAGGGGL